MLHDELVIESDASIAEEILTLAKQKMEESAGLVFKDSSDARRGRDCGFLGIVIQRKKTLIRRAVLYAYTGRSPARFTLRKNEIMTAETYHSDKGAKMPFKFQNPWVAGATGFKDIQDALRTTTQSQIIGSHVPQTKPPMNTYYYSGSTLQEHHRHRHQVYRYFGPSYRQGTRCGELFRFRHWPDPDFLDDQVLEILRKFIERNGTGFSKLPDPPQCMLPRSG